MGNTGEQAHEQRPVPIHQQNGKSEKIAKGPALVKEAKRNHYNLLSSPCKSENKVKTTRPRVQRLPKTPPRSPRGLSYRHRLTNGVCAIASRPPRRHQRCALTDDTGRDLARICADPGPLTAAPTPPPAPAPAAIPWSSFVRSRTSARLLCSLRSTSRTCHARTERCGRGVGIANRDWSCGTRITFLL